MITGGPFQTHSRQVTTTAERELPLFKRPMVDRDEMNRLGQKDQLAYLLSILRDARWHTAKELRTYGFNDRELRELVESSDGQVFSFPGSPGYKLFDFVTEEEFVQCSSLKHQAERMLARYSRYHARHHRGK
jgi:hypothetical protein